MENECQPKLYLQSWKSTLLVSITEFISQYIRMYFSSKISELNMHGLYSCLQAMHKLSMFGRKIKEPN